jgi:hypothetical protein
VAGEEGKRPFNESDRCRRPLVIVELGVETSSPKARAVQGIPSLRFASHWRYGT